MDGFVEIKGEVQNVPDLVFDLWGHAISNFEVVGIEWSHDALEEVDPNRRGLVVASTGKLAMACRGELIPGDIVTVKGRLVRDLDGAPLVWFLGTQMDSGRHVLIARRVHLHNSISELTGRSETTGDNSQEM